MHAAWAMVGAGLPGSRQVVAGALQRADEPGEALAYWMTTHGRAVPKPVKRGIADAARRLYTEYGLLKYDTGSKGFRFGDVVDLTHPTPSAPWQGDLFAWSLARRHQREQAAPESLAMIGANARLRADAVRDPRVLLDPQALKAAGMTWEDVLSLAGSTVDKGRLWAALIPSMGYMALLRNLRNFDEAGVPDAVAAQVAARLADPEQVAASRQFPFRFLAAYRAAAKSLRWSHALERALHASLANVPALPGRTLILVDLSGSMSTRAGTRSELTRADVAKVFGAALALRTHPTLVWFDDKSGQVQVPKATSLLALVESFPRAGGGTSTGAAVQRWYKGHDRVVIVTDEQAHYTGHHNVAAAVPEHVPVYTWNLGGYRLGHAPSGLGTRHTFGGLTDQGFKVIPLLERGEDTAWPF
jgi:TROVE domain